MKKIISLAFAITMYNLFFFPLHIPAFGRVDSLLIISTALVSLWIAFWPKDWSMTEKIAAGISTLAFAATGLSIYHASFVDRFLLTAQGFLLLFVSSYVLTTKSDLLSGVMEILFAPINVVKQWLKQLVFFTDYPEQWKLITSSTGFMSKVKDVAPSSTTFWKVVRGLLLAVPIGLLVIVLLIDADPVFSGILKDSLNAIKIDKTILNRILYSSFLLFLLVPAVNLVIEKDEKKSITGLKWSEYTIEAMIVVSSIAFILGAFLVVQFNYLFAKVAETELHRFGIYTYSEYVRRGFGELLAVMVISYLVTSFAYMTYAKNKVTSVVENVKENLTANFKALFSESAKSSANDSMRQKLLLLSTLLLAETAVFVFSIARRVYLYQLDHGLTRVRIYGMAFVIYVFALLVFLGLRFYKQNKNLPWHLYELGFGVFLLFAVVWWKPDYQIATRYQPTVNNEVDYVYITRLSADSVVGWVEAYEHAKEVYNTAPLQSDANPDSTRPVIYAQRVLSQLHINYANLVLRYGTLEEYMELYEFAPNPDGSPNKKLAQYHFDIYAQRGTLEFNQAEYDAYLMLRKEIDGNELRILKKDVDNYLIGVANENQPKTLDRSFDSPLVR